MSHPCTNWRDGECSLGLYGGRPSAGVCLRLCAEYDGPSRGLGDTVAKAIHAATAGLVRKCAGCAGRQLSMNSAVPYELDSNQRTV